MATTGVVPQGEPLRTEPGPASFGQADDGTVEAVEIGGNSFALGVQWHAELLVGRPERLALFQGLVGAPRLAPATRRRRRRPSTGRRR